MPKNTLKLLEGHLPDADSGAFGIDVDWIPLFEPGEYEMTLAGYRTKIMYRGAARKLMLDFRFVSGRYQGLTLPRYYNVKELVGPIGVSGSFKVGGKSDFLREYCSLFPAQRRDRFTMRKFNGVVLLAEISTVKQARGRRLSPETQYSKVSRLLRVVQ